MKLTRVLTWRVKAKALLTMPFFVTMLIATQTVRKTRKWLGIPLR